MERVSLSVTERPSAITLNASEQPEQIAFGATGYVGSAYSPQVDVAESESGHVVTITYKDAELGITEKRFDVANGETGARGPQGERGPKGDTGERGPQGIEGKAGVDGISPTATVAKDGNTTTITITDASGTTTAQLTDGADGRDGHDGRDGIDGISPTAKVERNASGALVTITDKNGTTTAQVMDGRAGDTGATGPQGPAGADGVSPTASVTQTASGATITVTDKGGTTTATVHDGEAGPTGPTGPAGADGTSPTVEVAPVTGGHSVTITDAAGAHSFDVLDGTGATIIGTLFGNPAAASDAIAAAPKALTVGGNSTQDGTPTPEAPVAIESVDELAVYALHRNLFNKEMASDYSNWNTSKTYAFFAIEVPANAPVIAHYAHTPIGVSGCHLNFSDNAGKGSTSRQLIGPTAATSHNSVEVESTANGRVYLNLHIKSADNLAKVIAAIGDILQIEVGNTAHEYAPFVNSSYSTLPIDLQGHQLRSLPDGIRDELRVDESGNVTLAQRIGVTTTATTDGITATVGTDAMSTTGGLEDGATVIYKLATPVETPLGTVTLPALPAPDMTAWATGGSATLTLEVTYERNLSIVIANIEAQLADLATS